MHAILDDALVAPPVLEAPPAVVVDVAPPDVGLVPVLEAPPAVVVPPDVELVPMLEAPPVPVDELLPMTTLLMYSFPVMSVALSACR